MSTVIEFIKVSVFSVFISSGFFFLLFVELFPFFQISAGKAVVGNVFWEYWEYYNSTFHLCVAWVFFVIFCFSFQSTYLTNISKKRLTLFYFVPVDYFCLLPPDFLNWVCSCIFDTIDNFDELKNYAASYLCCGKLTICKRSIRNNSNYAASRYEQPLTTISLTEMRSW